MSTAEIDEFQRALEGKSLLSQLDSLVEYFDWYPKLLQTLVKLVPNRSGLDQITLVEDIPYPSPLEHIVELLSYRYDNISDQCRDVYHDLVYKASYELRDIVRDCRMGTLVLRVHARNYQLVADEKTKRDVARSIWEQFQYIAARLKKSLVVPDSSDVEMTNTDGDGETEALDKFLIRTLVEFQTDHLSSKTEGQELDEVLAMLKRLELRILSLIQKPMRSFLGECTNFISDIKSKAQSKA